MIRTERVYSAELLQFLNTYMTVSRNRIQRVEAQRDALDVRTGVYGDLKTQLRTLKDLAEELGGIGGSSAFGAKSATSTNDSVVTATAGSGALSMGHTIHVHQLARAYSVVSDRITAADTTLSAAHEGTKGFSITVDGETHDISVDIVAGETNEEVLAKIATAVNDASDLAAGASKIADSSTTVKLSLFSAETGLENKISFTDTDGLLAAIGVSAGVLATETTGGYIYADEELDAGLTVDGIAITHSSNSVTGVLTGVTLELNSAQLEADADVTIDVSVDTEAITAKVQEFLTAYNEAFGYLRGKVSVDKTTYARGDLAGDYPYVNLWQNMRTALAGSVSTVEGGIFYALSQIGITSNSTGSFSISDTEDFEEALANHLGAVEDLFNSADGIAGRLEGLLDQYVSASGIIHGSENSISSRRELLDGRIDRLGRLQDMEEAELIRQYGALQEAMSMSQSLQGIVNFLYSGLI
ncbi:MAG: flagellar filament capping protein FliD [Candidatus Eisenbacteria bacterium]